MCSRDRIAHRFITLTTLLFIAEIVAIHFIYNERTFCSNNLSVYALGPKWYIITSGFYFCAINYFLIARLFWHAGEHASRGLRFGVCALLFLGIDTLAIAVFPADFGRTESPCGWTHEIAAYLHFMVLPLAALALRRGLPGEFFNVYNRITKAFAFLLMGIGLLIIGDNFMPEGCHMEGVLQKFLIVVIQFWVLYSSRKLIAAIEQRDARAA